LYRILVLTGRLRLAVFVLAVGCAPPRVPAGLGAEPRASAPERASTGRGAALAPESFDAAALGRCLGWTFELRDSAKPDLLATALGPRATWQRVLRGDGDPLLSVALCRPPCAVRATVAAALGVSSEAFEGGHGPWVSTPLVLEDARRGQIDLLGLGLGGAVMFVSMPAPGGALELVTSWPLPMSDDPAPDHERRALKGLDPATVARCVEARLLAR
jgi:hypothetical protein